MFSACTLPLVIKLPADILPEAVTTLLDLLNVNAVLVLALPASLNTTPVLEPGITILPLILPTTLPIKFAAVTLPVTVMNPLPLVSVNVTFAVLLPTTKLVNVPTEVILGCADVVSTAVVKLAVSRFPALILVAAILPVTVRTLVDLLKVKLALPPRSPPSLN